MGIRRNRHKKEAEKMKSMEITAVGIDVSKSKSTVAVRRPGGEIVLRPFEVHHTNSDLKKLTSTLKKLRGDIRIVMEHTSMYWRPIALTLKEAGFFVSVVNAMLIHDFSDNTIRKLKTDRADALTSHCFGGSLLKFSELGARSIRGMSCTLSSFQPFLRPSAITYIRVPGSAHAHFRYG